MPYKCNSSGDAASRNCKRFSAMRLAGSGWEDLPGPGNFFQQKG